MRQGLTAMRIACQWRLDNFCRAVGMIEKVFCNLSTQVVFVQCLGEWALPAEGLLLLSEGKWEVTKLREPLRSERLGASIAQGHCTSRQRHWHQKQCTQWFIVKCEMSFLFAFCLQGLPGQAKKTPLTFAHFRRYEMRGRKERKAQQVWIETGPLISAELC